MQPYSAFRARQIALYGAIFAFRPRQIALYGCNAAFRPRQIALYGCNAAFRPRQIALFLHACAACDRCGAALSFARPLARFAI